MDIPGVARLKPSVTEAVADTPTTSMTEQPDLSSGFWDCTLSRLKHNFKQPWLCDADHAPSNEANLCSK